MAASLGTFWTLLFALPCQTSFFLPPPSHSQQPQQHRPCCPNHKATQVPHRSRRHGHQMMNNDEVSPPSPLLFANPRTRYPMMTQCRPGRTQWRWQQATRMTGNDNDNDGRQWQRQRGHAMMTACHDEAATRMAARVHHHHHPPTAHHHAPPMAMRTHQHHYHQQRQWSITTHTQWTATQPPPAPTNSNNPLWTMNTAHHDPLPMANTAYHDPIPMANMAHHLPLPTVRTAQHQHPHGAPHPTNGEHCPPLPTIFDDGPPPAPTNCTTAQHHTPMVTTAHHHPRRTAMTAQCTLPSPTDSMWTPYGKDHYLQFHIKSKWTPGGLLYLYNYQKISVLFTPPPIPTEVLLDLLGVQ